MKLQKLAVAAAALSVAVMLGGCASKNQGAEEDSGTGTVIGSPTENLPSDSLENLPSDPPEITPELPDPPAEEAPLPEEEESEPVVETVKYIRVTGDGVNIRTGAGTSYASLGAAEKNTLYAYLGKSGSWYKTVYRNKTVYISDKYCELYEMQAADERIEAVIAEGCKLLGTPYVYGATRLHNGKGVMLSGFTVNAFDCSSLMQYIFYKGADALIDVNTRTQVLQGKTVSKSQLQRGDLMFFTNDTRKNYTGIERVGHVALYLGDNLILHTASDYAKIEEISAKRWSYFIQGQRIL